MSAHAHLKTDGSVDRALVFERVRALGNVLTPENIGATLQLFAPLHSPVPPANVEIVRDLRYGEADRHRLDLFVPRQVPRAGLPVLAFVHGGGFVGGDKSTAGSPFYDNIGLWAANAGFIGANLTYRLAPAHQWPSGSDDVGRAMRFLRERIPAHGGDADRIFLMGQSAGAVHVAGYVARLQSSGQDAWSPAGAILVSGLFDTDTMERNAFFEAYFGSDGTLYRDRPFLDALAKSRVPLLVATAEHDPLDFLRQHVALLNAYLQHHRRLPNVAYLAGHNHLSPVLDLNTPDAILAGPLLAFMESRK